VARKAKVRRDSQQSGAQYERRTERLKAWATLVTAFGSLGGLGGLAVYSGLFSFGQSGRPSPSAETGNVLAGGAVPAVPAPSGPQAAATSPPANQGGGMATVQVESTVTETTGRSTVQKSVKCTGPAAYCSHQLLAARQAAQHLQQTIGASGPPPSPPPPLVPPPVPVPPPVEPTPPPPPPPCVAGPFMVFFDWDRDEIAPQASATLDNAASAYQTCGPQAQVMIAGHADRSGPDQYNVGLSQRRAANVRSYLAGRGIPDGVMTTEASGESRPLVETADGVREPQNRRVEVGFGPGSS